MKISDILLGELSFKIHGFELEKLADSVYKMCKVKSLYIANDELYVTINTFQRHKLMNLLEGSDYLYEIRLSRGLPVYFSKYIARFGLLFGAIAASFMVWFLSSFIFKIDITGTENPSLRASILGVLKSEGICAGSYISSDDFSMIESRLFDISEDIAWASVSRQGSLLTVKISESTNKTSSQSKRIPTNIVASRDGVIINAEVLSGKLSVLIGSAVSEGELLVSGIVERTNGRAYYYHSIATITAEFEETFEIHQDYVCEEKVPSKTVKTYALQFFDYELDLPSFARIEGEYVVSKSSKMMNIFGIEFPLGIVTNEYTLMKSDVKVYTAESALNEAYRRLEIIEESLLKNNEIIGREVEEIFDENGVTLKARYVLRGDIGSQVEIFAN